VLVVPDLREQGKAHGECGESRYRAQQLIERPGDGQRNDEERQREGKDRIAEAFNAGDVMVTSVPKAVNDGRFH